MGVTRNGKRAMRVLPDVPSHMALRVHHRCGLLLAGRAYIARVWLLFNKPPCLGALV